QPLSKSDPPAIMKHTTCADLTSWEVLAMRSQDQVRKDPLENKREWMVGTTVKFMAGLCDRASGCGTRGRGRRIHRAISVFDSGSARFLAYGGWIRIRRLGWLRGFHPMEEYYS